MTTSAAPGGGRKRGGIRRHGQGWQARVSAGLDPGTGERIVLHETVPIPAARTKAAQDRAEREAYKEARLQPDPHYLSGPRRDSWWSAGTAHSPSASATAAPTRTCTTWKRCSQRVPSRVMTSGGSAPSGSPGRSSTRLPISRGRLPEHYDDHLVPLLTYSQDRKTDPFRPYGSTVGHWFEWARLALQLAEVLPVSGAADREQLTRAADALFDNAVREGWSVDGARGFVYTVDWDGTPVIRQRLHWVLCEALQAAAMLWQVCGDPHYADVYDEWWRYAEESFIDRVHGSWRHELDRTNRPAAKIRRGKADLYHALQASIVPRIPVGPSIAVQLASVVSSR